MLSERDLNKPAIHGESGSKWGEARYNLRSLKGANNDAADTFDLSKRIRQIVVAKDVDWGLTLELLDHIRDGDRKISSEALSQLRTHIRSYNSNVDYCINALQVLDACVKNCTMIFHAELATVKWMQLLSKVARQSKDTRITSRIHQMFSDWRHALGSSPELRQFTLVCTQLETHGIILPPPETLVTLPSPAPTQATVSGMPTENIVSPLRADADVEADDVVEEEGKENYTVRIRSPISSRPQPREAMSNNGEAEFKRMANARLSFPYSPGQDSAVYPHHQPSPVDHGMFQVHYAGASDAPPSSTASTQPVLTRVTDVVGGGAGDVNDSSDTAASSPKSIKNIRRQMTLITRYRFPSQERDATCVSRPKASLAVRNCQQWLARTHGTIDEDTLKTREELEALLALVGDISRCQGPAESEYNKLISREIEIEQGAASDLTQTRKEYIGILAKKTEMEGKAINALKGKSKSATYYAATSTTTTTTTTTTNGSGREGMIKHQPLVQQRDEHEMQHLRSEIASLQAQLHDQQGQTKAQLAQVRSSHHQHIKGTVQQLQSFQTQCRDVSESVQELRSDAQGVFTSFMTQFNQLQDVIVQRVLGSIEDTVQLKQRNEMLEERFHKEVAKRKKVHNQLQELKGNIRVVCRVRPVLGDESHEVVSFDQFTDDEIAIINPKNSRSHTFTFDKVNPPTSTQEEVFAETQELITSVLDGYNVCIFAYGQTGSGKTYTMEGPLDNPGVNIRAVRHLFTEAEQREGYTFRVSFSMLEIYNEQIHDLLDPDNNDIKLDVRQGEDGNYVPNLSSTEYDNADDLLTAMTKAYENRCVGGTMMNEQSSRSHCVVTIRVDARSFSAGVHTRSCLHLVDLAGSERLSKSEATGDRLVETQAINKSLSALGDVICASKAQKKHIPYRNSKLTYLLQDSLGGNSKTMMFVNISPSSVHAQESICSLKFASRVHEVELGKAKANKTVFRTMSNKK